MDRAMAASGAYSPVVVLRPADLSDRERVFEWCTASDATAAMIGPPEFPDHPVPTREEFFDDYHESFFDERGDGNGRVFVLEVAGRGVGCISYDGLRDWHGFAELDIWIASAVDQGRGWGSEAIRRLSGMLLDVDTVAGLVIRPSRRNVRAIAAYRRAGFVELDLGRHSLPESWLSEGLDYSDAVVLVRLRGSQ
ncbi:MAG: GNAT family N-acetyltransferase [Planctomycetota bacterium]